VVFSVRQTPLAQPLARCGAVAATRRPFAHRSGERCRVRQRSRLSADAANRSEHAISGVPHDLTLLSSQLRGPTLHYPRGPRQIKNQPRG